MDPLAAFSPATRAWFEGAFAAPTPAQQLGWPAIAAGGDVLIQAPTGSGKTLTAFLYAIDRLNASPGEGLRVIYVSPLDRKSTRLNSSHMSISYAVFCLKKKKINNRSHEAAQKFIANLLGVV